MSKLFRSFSPQSESSSRSGYTKEESMKRSASQSYEAPSAFNERAEMAATNLNTDVEIHGSIKFNESLRLDGKFEGELTSETGLLIIGKNGNIDATIKVGSAIIEGKVNGNIIAKDKVELRSTAQHFGDVQASRLVVEEGVVFVGKCDVNPKQTKIEPIRPEVAAEESDEIIEEEEEAPQKAALSEEESDDDLQEDFLR